MIIEICGPPGVGKTTLARALWKSLRDREVPASLASSYRPSEQRPSEQRSGTDSGLRRPRRPLDAMRRFTRPMREILSLVHELPYGSDEVVLARRLIRLMPPDSALWSVRLHQYIWRISHVWHRASETADVTIFDQAFVQAICSLILLGSAPTESRIKEALALVPRPDLLVRLDAPRDVLEARLIERERRQGRIDRLLEFDLATNLRSIDVLYRLRGMMRAPDVASIDVQCSAAGTLDHAVETLLHAVLHEAEAA